MKLVTTMGMELTYVCAAVQVALNRGAKFTPDAAEYHGETALLEGFQRLLLSLVSAKGIETYNGVQSDPGVVEVPTKPYTKMADIIRVARALRKEAEAIGLSVHEEYTGGGGAHIHTGLIGKTETERVNYARRMMVWAAQNPWFAWATLDVIDEKNARPIPRHKLLEGDDQNLTERLEAATNSLAMAQRNAVGYTEQMHAFWKDDEWRRDRYERYAVTEQRDAMRYRKEVITLRRLLAAQKSGDLRDITSIEFRGGKGYMFNRTFIGGPGTIEFRSFEMGYEDKLKRNIILANAVCKYVAAQTYTTVDVTTVMTGEVMKAMTWSAARKGWLDMLATLGLDPMDFREETARIAQRWRFYRTIQKNPTSATVGRPAINYENLETYAQITANRCRDRAIARNERNVVRRERIAARRAYREGVAAGLIAAPVALASSEPQAVASIEERDEGVGEFVRAVAASMRGLDHVTRPAFRSSYGTPFDVTLTGT
jgi:hypothetical protein